jgi:hypothetical protein
MDYLKPIAYLSAIVIAFLFVFIFPGSGIENIIIPIIGSLAGGIGLTNWRNNYGQIKDWFKSKTIWGALFSAVPVIASVVVGALNIALPGWVTTLLASLITIGGGASLIGIISAVNVNNQVVNKTGS